MRVVIFSGTTEGRALSAELAGLGAQVTAWVATEYGRALQAAPGVELHAGRLDAQGMAQALAGADLCIDATHPYAREASRNIRQGAEIAGVPRLRLLRRESPLPPGCAAVDSPEEAARFLEKTQGNVLLTTGAKELAAFAPLGPQRLYPRVLPAPESLAACEALGIPRGHIIAMQGPFSYQLNLALLEHFSIRWLVTKDGGAAGGFTEKARAARDAQAGLVVLRRPREEGDDYETVLRICKEKIACR